MLSTRPTTQQRCTPNKQQATINQTNNGIGVNNGVRRIK